ncbi:MAG: 2-keto-4-pentenoate hydratase [Beijerinckiaceae bacterium]
MTGKPHDSVAFSPREADLIASAFAAARRGRIDIAAFPGAVPGVREASYAVQDAQIARRGERVAGWKVAMTAPAFRDAFGAERLSGPVFESLVRIRDTSTEPVEWRPIPRGFAAVEAEFVAVLGEDAPLFGRQPSIAEAAALVRDIHIGIELAGSPLASINDIGPFAVAADCGNNDGVVLGPAIRGWRERELSDLTSAVAVNGVEVGTGRAEKVKGGPLEAVAFLMFHLESRGRRLLKGDLVSTGATTGIHVVQPGDAVEVSFGPDGALLVNVV